MISQYVTDHAYGIQSGIAIEAAGVKITGGKYVWIESSGTFKALASTFGIDSSAGASAYAIWAGASTGASSPFRVKPDGTVYLTSLIAIGENGTETTVNLRTAGLWKLGSANVKNVSVSNNVLTISRFSGGDVSVNFIRAAAIVPELDNAHIKSELEAAADHKIIFDVLNEDNDDAFFAISVDASGVFTQGRTAGYASGRTDWQPTGIYVDTRGLEIWAENADGDELINNSPGAVALFNAGWNAALNACASEAVYTSGTWYAKLYEAPAVGAPATSEIVNCRAGQNQITRYTLPARK